MDASSDFQLPSSFEWTEDRSLAAVRLADGHTQVEVATEVGVSDRTLRNWLQNVDFAAEVDRLSLMVGAASKAERLRIAKRVIRQRCANESVETEKDVLDWIKYAQSETTGVVLNLPALIDAAKPEPTAEPAISPPVAGSGSGSGESETVN